MDASGVKVYILDTGIQGTHTEFSGMIDSSSTCHGDFVNEGNPLSDGHGHGYVICTTYDMYILCHVNHNLTVLFFSTLTPSFQPPSEPTLLVPLLAQPMACHIVAWRGTTVNYVPSRYLTVEVPVLDQVLQWVSITWLVTVPLEKSASETCR